MAPRFIQKKPAYKKYFMCGLNTFIGYVSATRNRLTWTQNHRFEFVDHAQNKWGEEGKCLFKKNKT